MVWVVRGVPMVLRVFVGFVVWLLGGSMIWWFGDQAS